ncbi:MAG: neutral/alkaline non-lysosomal ceramidase N-terminal domain-containing protein [Elusimicrobiota bacterium]
MLARLCRILGTGIVFFCFLTCCNRAEAAWFAAAGKADITPNLSQERVWIAGFGADGRKPTGIHDKLYVRALLISDGKKTTALVAIDSIGLFRRDVDAIRKEAGWSGRTRYLFVSATHSHSAPDSLGLWGRFPGISGVNTEYRSRVIKTAADLVRRLKKQMAPAVLYAARTDVNPRGLCRDSRDPVIIDPELDTLQLRRPKTNAVIGTLVRWSCHPEVLWDDNTQISADYPGVLCRRIENKTGGACVFESGVIGGLLTPDADRRGGVSQEIKEMNRIGKTVANDALKAVSHARPIPSGTVSFRFETPLIPVENSRYLLLLPSLTFGHRILNRYGRPLSRLDAYLLALKELLFFPIPKSEEPRVRTEAALIRIGPIKILGIPGEMFPELDIGGYHGRYSFGYSLIKPKNPNPPDLALAPKAPYLRQELKARIGIVVGLANDELGYIIPNYDFKISRTRLMLPRLPGDHYEETNSIGPSAAKILLGAYKDILDR